MSFKDYNNSNFEFEFENLCQLLYCSNLRQNFCNVVKSNHFLKVLNFCNNAKLSHICNVIKLFPSNCLASKPKKWTELSLIGIVNSVGLMSINLDVQERERRVESEKNRITNQVDGHRVVSIAHYLLKCKIVRVCSNLSCLNRYLTPRPEPHLIYHWKPISQVSRAVSFDVGNIDQVLRGAKRTVILALEIVSLVRNVRTNQFGTTVHTSLTFVNDHFWFTLLLSRKIVIIHHWNIIVTSASN